MNKMKAGWAIVSLTILSACNMAPVNDVQTDSLDYVPPQGQTQVEPVTLNEGLPVKKLVIMSGNDRREMDVEIASTDPQRRVGLMNRKALDENRGMLFVFQTTGFVNFWMKNTLIPLDMLFLDEKGVIKHIAQRAVPCTAANSADCPKYNSEAAVRYVLEINGGLAEKWGIEVGDKATWLQ